MNRDTFNRKYGHPSIAESEMDRKYRVFVREQQEQAMYEQAMRMQSLKSATAPAPGIGTDGVNEYMTWDYVEGGYTE
jgi:hypothetical protein